MVWLAVLLATLLMSAFHRRQQQTPVSNGFGIGAHAAVKSLADLAKPRSSAAVTALAAGFSSAKATPCGCGGEYLVVGQVASYDPVLSILHLRQCAKCLRTTSDTAVFDEGDGVRDATPAPPPAAPPAAASPRSMVAARAAAHAAAPPWPASYGRPQSAASTASAASTRSAWSAAPPPAAAAPKSLAELARPRTAAQVSELAAKFRQDGTTCTRPGCSAEMLVIGQRAEYTDTAVNVLQFRQCAKCMDTSNAAATYK